MEEGDRNTIHGTAEISTGNREDLFKPTVMETLVNIVCGGCGDMFSDHWTWEEHIRDMVELEDIEHNFVTQALDSEDPNVVVDGPFECPDCGNGYLTEDHRDNHRMTIGTSVRLVCSQCASLVPDMEKHLPRHKNDNKCGECGGPMRNLHDHMLSKHSGFMSVLIMQTVRCAGDGTTLVSLEIVLATNARFLASEVKPFEPEEDLHLNNNKVSAGQKRKKVEEAFNITHSAFALDDEFLNEEQMGSGGGVVVTSPDKDFSPPKKKKIKKPPTNSSPVAIAPKPEIVDLPKKDLNDYMAEFGMSERDRALCPPPHLPQEFFDAQGTRLWLKLQSRKGFHQCELCGFLAKTKNKYREKQDHLMKWHFSRRIDEILPTAGKKPFHCPLCDFLGKDRQCVVRHYTGKHQALDVWMGEFLDSLTDKSITVDILQSVENVDILAKPGQLQRPGRGKIINTLEDMKTFLSDSYNEANNKVIVNCTTCTKQFPSQAALNSHVQIDHNEKSRFERAHERIASMPSPDFNVESEDISVEVDIMPGIDESEVDIIPELDDSQDTEMDIAEDENLLILENGEGGTIRCLTCSNSKEAKLKSVSQLKDHIQNNHMDLCRLDYFVLCQSRDSMDSQKSFNYTMCCICGKCFSQNSTDEALRDHGMEHTDLSAGSK